MISKAQVKHIRSLDDKKNRYECRQFLVEGDKLIQELLKSNFIIRSIFATDAWLEINQKMILSNVEAVQVSDIELGRISNFKTPNEVLAIVQMPENIDVPLEGVTIALDNIQDPGNLGSIIRIADWYGIDFVFCNTNTVDYFNHKVLQATMGSIFNVKCFTMDLQSYFLQNENRMKYACVLNGESVHRYSKIDDGIILIGNESNGINEALLPLCNHKITIPRIGKAESLNAAVATGIICSSLI